MNPYHYQSEDFALSDDGVHLLRNRYNYKTIAYSEVEKATIRRAVEVKNSPVLLALGTIFLAFAFYQSRWVIDLFNDPTVYHIYIESIVLPVLPAAIGVYCLYTGLRKGPVLLLSIGNSVQKLRLRSLYKQGVMPDVEKYLDRKLGRELIVER